MVFVRFKILLGILFFIRVFGRQCEEKDIASSYTDCDPTTNKRSLIYYKTADCEGTLPQNIFGLPCCIHLIAVFAVSQHFFPSFFDSILKQYK